MNYKKVLLIISCLTFSSLLIYWHLSDEKRETKSINISSQPDRRSFSSFRGLSFNKSFDDNTGFTVKADKAFIRNRKIGLMRVGLQKVTEMEDVLVSFNEAGRELFNVRSDSAILNMSSGELLFEGHVIYKDRDFNMLKTEKLLWNRDKKIFKTDGSYVYTTKDGSLKTGKGFESAQGLMLSKF